MKPRLEIPRRNITAELRLAEELTVDPALAQVLYGRGLKDGAAAARFLFPELTSLTPPADFPGLDEAAELISQFCNRGAKKVFVAGDYDVDGLTATALLCLVLRRLGAAVDYYIPNRLAEGYDLSTETVRRALDAGAELLVTADCGSRAHEAVAAARREGLAVVVTDHHRLGETLPPADAVVTPQRLPEGHPARGFAGVGVAYKLAEEIIRGRGGELEAASLLPLVALGTVCDVVSLDRENRALVAAGLEAFPGELFPGLAAVMRETGIEAPVTSWHLAFIVGPRLNAAGRLGHPEYALELLLAEEEGRARAIARKLEYFNGQRRAFEERATAGALKRGAAHVNSGRRSIVLWDESWHPGVIGIVASRVVERFFRPTVLVAVEGDAGRGSCRSIPAFDVHEALDALRDYLGRFGGHRLAAGFDIERDRIPDFAEAFENFAAARLDDDALRPVVRVDGHMPLSAVNAPLVGDLALLEPAGQGNPAPTFYTETRVAAETQRVFKDAHVEVLATAGPVTVRAIGFNLAPDGGKLEPGEYGLVYTPVIDKWRDRERLELRLECILPVARGAYADGISAAALIDKRREGPGVVVSGRGPADAVFGLPGQEHLAGGCEFIPYASYVEKPRRWRRLWLAAPPFDAHRMAMVLVAADEVVLAFGDAEASAAKKFLGGYYPDRDRLAEVYRTWRERGPSLIEESDVGLRRAFEIFRELGLVEERGGDAAAPAYGPRLTGEERKRLDDSPLFKRCERRRETAEQFITAVCSWPAAALEELAAELSLAASGLDTSPAVL